VAGFEIAYRLTSLKTSDRRNAYNWFEGPGATRTGNPHKRARSVR